MFAGNAIYSQNLHLNAVSHYTILTPHMNNPYRRLEVHLIIYNTTNFLIWETANRAGSVSSVSILLEEEVSSLGSPNLIFIVLLFRKITVFEINVYTDLKRFTLNILHMQIFQI